MKRKVSFYKENGSWYADVPMMPKSSNLMVAGADTFLDKISEGHNRINMSINTKYIKQAKYALFRSKHDFWGGTYDVYNLGGDMIHKLWLCNVTHFVLGRHPKFIAIKDISYGKD